MVNLDNKRVDSSERLVTPRRYSDCRTCSIIVFTNIKVLLQAIRGRVRHVHSPCRNHETIQPCIMGRTNTEKSIHEPVLESRHWTGGLPRLKSRDSGTESADIRPHTLICIISYLIYIALFTRKVHNYFVCLISPNVLSPRNTQKIIAEKIVTFQYWSVIGGENVGIHHCLLLRSA